MPKATSDQPPSYGESIASPHHSPRPLESNLAAARGALVMSLVTTHIEPHLHTTLLSGLASTTLVLVPSNVSSLQPSPGSLKDTTTKFPGEKVVSLPSSENLTVARLREQESSLEFLRQPPVLQKITEQLCMYLDREGYCKIAVEQGMMWSREGGLLAAEDEAETGRAEAALQVKIIDVCMRVESEMGLYETRNGKCLIVKLEIKG